MTKANRVHSTPRRTASKSKPTRKLAPKAAGGVTQEERAKLYNAMEGPLCDALHMARIAEVAAGEEDRGLDIFATLHLVDMVRALHAIWNGQTPGPMFGGH